MKITINKHSSISDLIILPLFLEDGLAILKKLRLPIADQAWTDFKKEPGSTQVVYSQNQRVLLVGLGEKKSFKPQTWRIAIHSIINSLQPLAAKTAVLIWPSLPGKNLEQYFELTGFAFIYSAYRFNAYQTDKKPLALAQLQVSFPANQALEKAIKRGMIIGHAANSARDLANHPGNVATPTHLATHAKQIAKESNFSCKILGPSEIAQEGLGLVLGVSKGSEEPPRFIVLDYGDKKKQPIVLIGKGLTFDSGGISIKPAERMEEMKYDMAGGATVLGIFEAVSKLKLPVRLVGIIPSTENLLSGQAVKPGDILKAHDKTSVEIINTDAEGRLVLADAISYAQKHYQPKLIVDYATLTGAVLVALGDQYTGYFANTKYYDKNFQQAADKIYEPLWPLPLADEYRDQLKSSVADIKNVGEKGLAGAITAALFLEHFVKKVPWIHLDIAGTAWTVRPKNFVNTGATAWGVYLTVELLRSLKS